MTLQIKINIVSVSSEYDKIHSFLLNCENNIITIDIFYLNNYLKNINTYVLVYNLEPIYYNFCNKSYIKLKIDNKDIESKEIYITLIITSINENIFNLIENYKHVDDYNFYHIIITYIINNNIYNIIKEDNTTLLYILYNCPKFIIYLSDRINIHSKTIINYIKLCNNYNIIKYINKEEYLIEAVRQNSLSLLHLNTKAINKNILLEAVKQNGNILYHIYRHDTFEMKINLNIYQYDLIDKYVIFQKLFSEKNLTNKLIDEEIIIAAINQNPFSINFVPHKLLNENIILMAYELNKESIKYLKHDLYPLFIS